MKTIIIRDDDISYFTSPKQLETIYGRLWDANIPVCFAVIPAPRGDVRVLHREGHPIDPSIPIQYRGESKNFVLADNPEICDFLNEKAKSGLLEVCLHGFEHNFHEFEIEDADVLQNKVERGLSILQSALPDVCINTFIAPYDEISPIAFDILRKHDFTICTRTETLKQTPYADMLSYQKRNLSDTGLLYTADDYFFTRHLEPSQCLAMAENNLQEQDLNIVVNHYWTFFFDWNGNWEAMLEAWNRYIDQLLALEDAQFLTFAAKTAQ
jgi:hypothetical protein